MTRLTRLVPRAAAVLAILLCQAWTQSALAHAVLMDSSPKAGQMLETAPKEVSVTFNENVGPIFFKLLDRTGKEVGAPGEIRLDGFSMILPLNEDLPNGTYVLTYRVISADTHPVGATFGFSVGEPMADMSAMSAGADQGATAWTYAVAANRWVLYAAMLLAAGSALFTLLLNAPASVNAAAYALGRTGAIAAAIAYFLSIGFGGAEMVMGGAGALFAADTWSRGLASTLTPSAAIGIPGMLILIWAFAAGPEKPKSGALAVGAAAAIGSFLVTGHAATAPPVWMMAPAVGVHLVATAFWMGALYPLYKSTRLMSVNESGALMTEFSTRAVWAVGAIVLSGVLITWTQVQSIGNLFGNDYATSLLSKLGLFVVVLALAAYNKTSLTPALERGDSGGAARIRTTIRVEYAVYILILGAAMTMTLTTPPRAIVAQGEGSGGMAMDMSGGFKATVQNQGYSAEFDLSPAKAGENMLMVTVKDSGGNVLTEMADLELVAALESAGISDITLKGEKMPNGMWHVMVKEMIIPGEWTLRVDAFVSDFDKVGFETKVQIK
ncbi:MAG: copper resistance protein CopC [Rhodospirillaceae bacterium]|nr:copper resistance protein CopC [Rhodospirillaceae bacterium]